MNRLEVRKFDEGILDHITLITNGTGYFKTFDLNNGNILKVVKKPHECLEQKDGNILFDCYDAFINELLGKLLESKRIETPEIITPNSIYMEGKYPKAYTVPKVTGFVDIGTYLDCKDLDIIAPIILKLSRIIRNANQEGIIMPDIGTQSNILINPETGEIKLIDYDGIQISRFQSFSIAGLLHNDVLKLTKFRTFYNSSTGLYNPNIDKLSLYVLFLYFTYNPAFANFKRRDFIHKKGKPVPIIKIDAIHDYFCRIGLDGTLFEKELQNLFFSGACNYPDEAIEEIVKEYKLVIFDQNKRFTKR